MASEQGLRDERGRFLPGHQFSRKDPDELDMLVDKYCEHRARGMDKESFIDCDYRTIEKSATNLQAEKIRQAEARGWQVWENISRMVALGQNVILPDGRTVRAKNCNPVMIIYTMKCKFRSVYGDKVEQAVKVEQPEEIDYTKLSDAALQEIANARIKSR